MRAILVLAAAVWLSAAAAAAQVADTLARPATRVARPAQAVLLGVARAGARLVAVGERGLVVVSDDQGRGWRQVPVPVSVTLTAVRFASARAGWAVGHRGVVLHTDDGGDTWTRQLDGVQFAAIARQQAAAAAVADTSSAAARALADADALVRDGADKPFLAVDFADERHGLAVGAYGLCARTDDAGAHWTSCIGELPNPKAAHLYAIARAAGATWVVGEQGLVLRAAAPGAPFEPVAVPYAGSFFCVGIAGDGSVLLGGLRGNAFAAAAGGAFERVDTGRAGSCAAAARGADGRLLVVDELGQVSRFEALGRRLDALPGPPSAPLGDLVALPDGALVVVGVRGAGVLPARPSTS